MLFQRSSLDGAARGRRGRAAEEKWLDLLESALCSMLEYEMDEHRIRRAVEKSAIVADEALAQFEKRWR